MITQGAVQTLTVDDPSKIEFSVEIGIDIKQKPIKIHVLINTIYALQNQVNWVQWLSLKSEENRN